MQLLELDSNSKYLKQIKHLYIQAFPIEERIDYSFLIQALNKQKAKILALVENEKLLAMMYYFYHKDLLYLLYFAVDQAQHSKGYGKYMLDQLKTRYSNYKIMLLIEKLDENASNNEQRLRRKNFYLNNGFISKNIYVKRMDVDYELLYLNTNNISENNLETIENYFFDI